MNSIVTTNTYCPHWMVENFISMIDANEGRIFNTGSLAGPMYTIKVSEEDQKAVWNNPNVTWEELDAKITAVIPDLNNGSAYTFSKGAVAINASIVANKYPNIKSSTAEPGVVDTAIVADFTRAKVSKDWGTVSIRHCLFAELKNNGWFYGCDGLRSPLLTARNGGDPEYDGKWKWTKANSRKTR